MEHAQASPSDIAAILITLAAALSWINHRFLKLPSSVGLALMGAVASIVTLAIDAMFPAARLAESARALLADIDFETTLMEGMLSPWRLPDCSSAITAWRTR